MVLREENLASDSSSYMRGLYDGVNIQKLRDQKIFDEILDAVNELDDTPDNKYTLVVMRIMEQKKEQ